MHARLFRRLLGASVILVAVVDVDGGVVVVVVDTALAVAVCGLPAN